MPFYESTFIVRPDASPQQVEALAGEMETLVKDQGGAVPKTEIWGLKSLAYKIKKNRKGHYVYMTMEAPAAALGELERNLHFNEDVLRFMSIKIDELDPEASPMMRNKSSREDRSIRRDGEREPDVEEAGEAAKAEAPKVEAAKAETPTVEAAKAETPTVEASEGETPTVEASEGETTKEGDN
jgi:small subunit ribosomal protein S6